MSKLGLIADIHGDWAGFQAALNLLEREGAADLILCAGDAYGLTNDF